MQRIRHSSSSECLPRQTPTTFLDCLDDGYGTPPPVNVYLDRHPRHSWTAYTHDVRLQRIRHSSSSECLPRPTPTTFLDCLDDGCGTSCPVNVTARQTPTTFLDCLCNGCGTSCPVNVKLDRHPRHSWTDWTTDTALLLQ